MGGNETMTKRFTVDEKGYFDKKAMRYVTVDYLMDLVNGQDQQIKELKRMLQLISESESFRNENSVKEIVRNNLFGLDSVTGESANAFNDYLLLNKFFKEYYNEHWDNDKFD